MKVAVYPGSFNPWHEGHTDVLIKAQQVFDKVIVAVGFNPDKGTQEDRNLLAIQQGLKYNFAVEVVMMNGLLVNFLKEFPADAIIKGLRNGQDLEYERVQQYWNEDLGITIPTVYFVSDRKLVHISSSAIRAVGAFNVKR